MLVNFDKATLIMIQEALEEKRDKLIASAESAKTSENFMGYSVAQCVMESVEKMNMVIGYINLKTSEEQ